MDPRLKPIDFTHLGINDMSDDRPRVDKIALDIVDGVEDIGERGHGKYGGDILDSLFYEGNLRGLYRALSTSTKEQLESRDASGKCIIPSSYMFLSLCFSSNIRI
jgi:hypothetical protein